MRRFEPHAVQSLGVQTAAAVIVCCMILNQLLLFEVRTGELAQSVEPRNGMWGIPAPQGQGRTSLGTFRVAGLWGWGAEEI